MNRLSALWRNLFHRDRLNRDLDEELGEYVESVSAEKMRSGMPPEEAYRAARREMGGVDQVRQRVRDIRAGALLERLAQDIRYAARTLVNKPGFTLVAAATLALGIGANAAMFSLLDQIVLSLLPVRHPEQLVIVRETGNHYGNSYGINTVSWPMFEDLRDHNQVFSGMFCRLPHQRNRSATAICAAQIQAELVSASYFPILGVWRRPGPHHLLPTTTRFPTAGRSWFSATASGGTTLTVTAPSSVAPLPSTAPRDDPSSAFHSPDFGGVGTGNPARSSSPSSMKTEMTPQGRRPQRPAPPASVGSPVYGRLKPGISAEQAQASLQPLLHSILAMEVQQPFFPASSCRGPPPQFLRNRIELLPASDGSLRDHMRKPLWLLVALTAAVLLLACDNLANLMLARATAREREIAVRLAIGAARSRIVRQLMVETLLLSQDRRVGRAGPRLPRRFAFCSG